MDEKPYQFLSPSRPSLPIKPGKPEREDYEYIRLGTCSIFIFTEPLAGWRYAKAFSQRTKKDWAHNIKWLLDEQYPDVEIVSTSLPDLIFLTISLNDKSCTENVFYFVVIPSRYI